MGISNDAKRVISQLREIEDRILNGSFDPVDVREPLQMILEKRPLVDRDTWLGWRPPTWWRDEVDQLGCARKHWPNIDLPDPPERFIPRSKTGVLLLHVPDTFDSLWSKIRVPRGYDLLRSDSFESGSEALRFTPSKIEFTEPVWLEYDYAFARGKSPDQLWRNPRLAASEVLSAVIQFPDYPFAWLDWRRGAPAPNMSGYQSRAGEEWSHVPFLDFVSGPDENWLKVFSAPAGSSMDRYSSPSVREC